MKHVARKGFTVVELLIVIVVIAILATITVVGYQAVQDRAAKTALQSDLESASGQLESDRTLGRAGYPTTETAANGGKGLPKSDGTSYLYAPNGDNYCLTAYSSRKGVTPSFYSTATDTIQEGVCPEHVGMNPGEGGGGSALATMQSFTRSQCNALTTYTGSNPEAITTLPDTRGGTYEVAKLADNNCWMLQNLRLGSAAAPTTLTPSDSDIASTFTLPQLTTSGSLDYNNPRAYGPVTGDTGSGATDYGYLYNWPAATAGESLASHPHTAGDAPHSICASGWRLPTGGSPASDFGKLDIAFGGTGSYTLRSQSIPSWEKWQHAGPLKTVRSGFWREVFEYQDSWSLLTSSTAYDNDPAGVTQRAHAAHTNSSFVYPGDGGALRGRAIAVRCVLR